MTLIWSGLSIGCLYALVALTYNITMAQAGIFNFAAAQMVMVGAFCTYELTVVHHLGVWLAALVGAGLGLAISMLEERVAIRPLRNLHFGPLVTTVGAAVCIEGVAYVLYGSTSRSIPFAGGDEAFTLLGGRLQRVDIFLIVSAVVLTFLLYVLSTRTSWGLSGRAATLDTDAASIRGINVRLNRLIAFGAAGALGGALGPLVGPRTYASFDLGSSLVVYAFVATAIGGFGSYIGCLVGGLVVGMLQAEIGRYLGGAYPLLIIFLVLLVVLIVRPSGLLGDKRLCLI